jgi:hypothetical protein
MNRHAVLHAIALLTILIGTAAAQSSPKPAATDSTGFSSYAEFGGTSNSEGQIYELNSSVGYNFSQHFGMDLAVPIYFLRPSSSTGGTSTNGLGDPSIDAKLKFLNSAINFASVLTGYLPVGDTKKGLSTGHGTFDWTNHFDRSFSKLTPFGEAGIANTITSSRLFMRPYTTLGFNTHFRGGATYDVWKFFSLGASAYDILPSGQQTVFSRVSHRSNAGTIAHGRVFTSNQQTTGGADIAHDDGFSTWIDASPRPEIDMELAYTRSVHYDLNSVSFTIGFNLGSLYPRTKQ